MPNEENKIVIVEDDSRIIRFQDITIKNDSVDRDEVSAVEQEMKSLLEQRENIDKRLEMLAAKLEYAKRVIEIADKQKAEGNNDNHIETDNVADTEEVGG